MNLQLRTESMLILFMRFESESGEKIPQRKKLARFLARNVKADGLEKQFVEGDPEREHEEEAST